METRKHLLDWLRDAHAMEEQAVEILERQADRLETYPDAQLRIRQHRDETKRQAERIAECINRLNGDTSAVKDFGGKLMGNLSALTSAMAEDEVVKNAIANYSFESLEIASYTSLVAAAEVLGDEQTARVCREILREEEEMARWLEQYIPELTRSYLGREAAGVQSKR